MKLKTLLTVLAMLCISLFVVACGGGDDTTTADPGTQAPGATTTKATTTKKTTTKKTTTARVTTTTVTTTLDPNYMTKLPAALPNNETFQINYRIGLDNQADYLDFSSSEGKCTSVTWTNEGAVYGGALKFACSMTAGTGGTPNRAEGTLKLADSISPLGIKGVLFYTDFSDVEPDTTNPTHCVSVTLSGNTYRSHKGNAKGNDGIGYYYQNGEWVQTMNVNSCRMAIPHGFKGWVYVPLSSYNGSGELYDGTTGLGIEGKWLQNFNLYTDYYTYSDTDFILFDEILFVQ